MARVKIKPPEGFKTTLRLLGQRWSIEYYKPRPSDEDELGCCIGPDRKIRVCIDQHHESLVDTLYHEIIHAYLRMLPGFTDEPTLPSDPEQAEECIVVACTTAAMDLAANNAWVMELLLKRT